MIRVMTFNIRYGTAKDGENSIHSDSAPTFNAFGQRHDAADSAAIDWILVSQHFETLDSQVDRHTVGAVYPSDHYPVLAQIELLERR